MKTREYLKGQMQMYNRLYDAAFKTITTEADTEDKKLIILIRLIKELQAVKKDIDKELKELEKVEDAP